MEIIPVKEIFSKKGSLGGAYQHTKTPHPSNQCIKIHRGQNVPIFEVFLITHVIHIRSKNVSNKS